MGFRLDRTSLLPGFAALTATAATLLGPLRAHKLIVDGDESRLTSHIAVVLRSVASESPTMGLLRDAVTAHDRAHGTGCTLLVNLVHAFAEAALVLQAQSIDPIDIASRFQDALAIALATCDRMVINVHEWLREASFQSARGSPLEALGAALISDEWEEAMAMALAIAHKIPSLLSDAYRSLTAVHWYPTAGATNTRLVDGLVVPVDLAPSLARSPTHVASMVLIDGSIAFSQALCDALVASHADGLVAAYGIDAQLDDWCRAHHVVCFATLQLHAVAAAFQVPVFESTSVFVSSPQVSHLAPSVLVQRYQGSGAVDRTAEDDEPTMGFLQLTRPGLRHVSLFVRRSCLSLAQDAVKTIQSCLARLHHARYDDRMLPGGGAVLVAIAAALQSRENLAVIATAFESTGLQLLQNASSLPYLEAKSTWRRVYAAYRAGFHESDKFLETAFYGRQLRLLDDHRVRFDSYVSTKDGLRAATRLVTMTAMLGPAVINVP
ncbi:hypothetical protein SDRG_07198 [Saprolegnia diclina VS20]|uniref:Uncharacterized protein n=1 Tax=Saprolegnia diclina (strain VS20) TaxID=1156394 RepID=T0QNU3_SAPDV|nr:hypothetical protein SDRG_07198 [Saprolegnia diclina VS20]EQC35490.1 hypothetical protein SDRG_07198 [Saprolegnia diclina VS20]|eukprot:XP_008611240.1 hypothetical protein SDRG_07198 [Saprolegnia diclina VS20]